MEISTGKKGMERQRNLLRPKLFLCQNFFYTHECTIVPQFKFNILLRKKLQVQNMLIARPS